VGPLSLSFHFNNERELQLSINHVLTAEEIRTGWIFPLLPCRQCHRTDCLRFPPVIRTMIGSPGENKSVIFGTKFSELSEVPDYRGTTVLKIQVRKAFTHFAVLLCLSPQQPWIPYIIAVVPSIIIRVY
jgi:hypothetical protein